MADLCRATDERPECCHNCRNLVPDFGHPLTNGERISVQRGWVCLAPEMDGVYSGWTEHGMCEMWDDRTLPTSARPSEPIDPLLDCAECDTRRDAFLVLGKGDGSQCPMHNARSRDDG